MRSRFLAELTTPEIEEYLSKGAGTALLPVGSVEMHGPHQPVGTDTLIAQAFALKLAEAADGLVLPEVAYTWAGATDGFAGTISLEPELAMRTVEAVAVKVFRMGFARMVVLSVHAPNQHGLFFAVRRVFETHGLPVVFVDPFQGRHDDTRDIFEGPYAASAEASMVLAALHVLGRGELYSEARMAYEDQAPPAPEGLAEIGRIGTVGYFMQDPRQHACPSKHVSLAKGLEFIDKQVRHIASILAPLDRYTQAAAAQGNRGWWRPDTER